MMYVRSRSCVVLLLLRETQRVEPGRRLHRGHHSVDAVPPQLADVRGGLAPAPCLFSAGHRTPWCRVRFCFRCSELSLYENSFSGTIPESFSLLNVSYVPVSQRVTSWPPVCRLDCGVRVDEPECTRPDRERVGIRVGVWVHSSLDLSENDLSGTIPASLANITSLKYVACHGSVRCDLERELHPCTPLHTHSV